MLRVLLIVLFLKHTEGLLSGAGVNGGLMGYHVEPHRLAERTALSNGNDITILHVKGRRAVHSNVLMPLFETPVLGNVVQVVPANNNCTLHLGGNDKTLENATTDGDIAGKGALLVHIVSLDSIIGSLESKTNRLGVAHGLLVPGTNDTLACHENGILALVSLFVLIALNVLLLNARHGVKRKKDLRQQESETEGQIMN